MPRGRNLADVTTLQMALVGYQLERQKIDERIREIQAQLKGKSVGGPAVTGVASKSVGPKRVLSPAARRRIAAAQKKRWAEHRRRQAAAAKAAKQE